MFPGLGIIFLSRRGPVFLLVYITIRKIVIIIKIKRSFPYAGDSLCSRSASRTKHAVWISSLIDILLLDISVYATVIKAVFEIQC